jgi:hypothetical protein
VERLEVIGEQKIAGFQKGIDREMGNEIRNETMLSGAWIEADVHSP